MNINDAVVLVTGARRAVGHALVDGLLADVTPLILAFAPVLQANDGGAIVHVLRQVRRGFAAERGAYLGAAAH